MKIQFNDIKDPAINYNIIKQKISKVVDKKNFILGNEVEILENKLSKFTKSKYTITVSSGTDALLISLLSLNLKKNSEVLTPAFSYISSAEVIIRAGLKPVFCDVESDTALIDVDKLEKKINKNTSCIIIVSLFGQIPNVDKLKKIRQKYKIPIIEDGAQSFGSKFKTHYSCAIFDIGCTSFFPTKPLGCFGDGGAIFTNNKKIYLRSKQIRQHGQKKKYYFDIQGLNARLDTIQAVVLIEKLKKLKSSILRKRLISEKYKKLLKKNVNIKFLILNKNCQSSYPLLNIIVKNRDKLKNYLKQKKIPTIIYYPKALSDQKIFNEYKSKNNKMNNSRILAKKIISLPFHLSLKDKQLRYITDCINNFYIKK